jgi:hypothetical protein
LIVGIYGRPCGRYGDQFYRWDGSGKNLNSNGMVLGTVNGDKVDMGSTISPVEATYKE